METVKVYTKEFVSKLTRKRTGELKVGEVVEATTKNWKAELEESKAKFVIIGIPEDIGVRANYGRAGTNTAFKPALESFLIQQNNHFLNAESIFVLGEVFVDDIMEKASEYDSKSKSDITHLRSFVAQIDERVTEVIKTIIQFKKTPIVIGGGHNNAYGNISGAFHALNKKINVINCDAHLDFRQLDGRHSGNGFSYAFKNGFINKYSVFAMHEQYNSKVALDQFKNNPSQLFFNTYESIFVREELDFNAALKQSIGFVKNEVCGVELDLDAITNVPSSAKTSSGISPVQARQYVFNCAKNLNAVYLHIAEGAPVLSHIKADNKTGKLIAYLITDFIKGVEAR
ncbi:MAG: formimidoylglutamase [Bacteroidota bacterium]|nr:formimidoylglutamase [Bacteroidota bacterium]MDP3144745.1 formimidoylglutamase [Bacteroidota bacterium]